MDKHEEMIVKIAKAVARDCRIKDKEEAYSVALLGIARGLNTYKPGSKAKLGTYLFSCAKFECWSEWRRLHRLKRGKDVIILSIEELQDKGIDI